MRTIMSRGIGAGACGLLLLLAVVADAGCVADAQTKVLQQGWAQLKAGQPDPALAAAEKVLAEHPESPRAAEALYLKGRAHEMKTSMTSAEQSRHLSAANEAYRQALRHNPGPVLAGRIYAGLANTCYWMDDYSAAWRHWATAYDLADESDAKAYMLYRIGLCQQRLGRFADADKTFLAVQQQYPGSDAAQRARLKAGARSFAVQVATFASPQTADQAMQAIRREGFVPSRQPNAQGQAVVSVAPFASYQQAKLARDRLAGMFPDAVIVP